jgi:hypothetical protein
VIITHLQSRLASLPSDLGKLYAHMINSIEDEYKEDAAQIIQIFRASGNYLDVVTLERALRFPHYQQAIDMQTGNLCETEREGNTLGIGTNIERMVVRLNSRCKGLLEVKHMDESNFGIDDNAVPPVLQVSQAGESNPYEESGFVDYSLTEEDTIIPWPRKREKARRRRRRRRRIENLGEAREASKIGDNPEG